MARLSLHGPGAIVALLVLSCGATATGQVTALHIVSQPTPADVLPGYVANDIFIDFTGQYTGSQLIVGLSSGSIYHAPPPAGITPPPGALIGLPEFPTIQWDTFLAQGGATDEATIGNVGLSGPAISLDPSWGGGTLRQAVFSDLEIDQTWNPAGGTVVEDREAFLVARITLTDDATGIFHFRASAGGEPGPGPRPGGSVLLPIRNGFVIPEPSAVALLGISVFGLILLNRTRGWSRPFFEGTVK
jgi:hypothetical protein